MYTILYYYLLLDYWRVHGEIVRQWAPGHRHIKGPPTPHRSKTEETLWGCFVFFLLFCVLVFALHLYFSCFASIFRCLVLLFLILSLCGSFASLFSYFESRGASWPLWPLGRWWMCEQHWTVLKLIFKLFYGELMIIFIISQSADLVQAVRNQKIIRNSPYSPSNCLFCPANN